MSSGRRQQAVGAKACCTGLRSLVQTTSKTDTLPGYTLNCDEPSRAPLLLQSLCPAPRNLLPFITHFDRSGRQTCENVRLVNARECSQLLLLPWVERRALAGLGQTDGLRPRGIDVHRRCRDACASIF